MNSMVITADAARKSAVEGSAAFSPDDHHYGRRIEFDRTWTVYHVFNGAPARNKGYVMKGLSGVDATAGVLSLNRLARPGGPSMSVGETPKADLESAVQQDAAWNCAAIELLMSCAPNHTVLMLDLSGAVTSWNANASRLLGYAAPEILGRDFSCLFTGEARQVEGRRALQIAADSRRYVDQVWLTRKDQSRFRATVTIELVRPAGGEAIAYAGVIRDETPRADQVSQGGGAAKSEGRILQLEADNMALQQLADTDELTGILNLRGFTVLARREIARATRYERPMSILFLDIDRFKSINDQFGHAAGDRALKMVVEEMGRQMRKGDVIARIGGDEFVMLLPESKAAEAAKLAERICQAVTSATTDSAAAAFSTTVSIGVAQWISDETIDDLLARADAALYEIKSGVGNCLPAHVEPTPA